MISTYQIIGMASVATVESEIQERMISEYCPPRDLSFALESGVASEIKAAVDLFGDWFNSKSPYAKEAEAQFRNYMEKCLYDTKG